MLLRAVFWIGVVSVLMPHEPNLGYGSPSPGTALADKISHWADSAATPDKAAISEAEDQPVVQRQTRTLAQVKAEIAAARHPS